MSAGVEGVRGARQECDVDLVITCEFGGMQSMPTKRSQSRGRTVSGAYTGTALTYIPRAQRCDGSAPLTSIPASAPSIPAD